MDEYGMEAKIKTRFTGNTDCQNAFKNYMCYLNFPRCDDEERSLILCRTVCENFVKACNVGGMNFREDGIAVLLQVYLVKIKQARIQSVIRYIFADWQGSATVRTSSIFWRGRTGGRARPGH